MYESVFPNFEALTAIAQQTDMQKSETELSDHISSVPSTPDIIQSNSARYVDHPIQLSHLSTDQNESESNGGSQSQMTGNKQITHLTSSVADNRRETVCKTKASTTEETYTLMRSAGTLALSLSADWEEQQLD